MGVQPVHRVPCEYPIPYLWACCCGPCFAFTHRIEALGDRWPAEFVLSLSFFLFSFLFFLCFFVFLALSFLYLVPLSPFSFLL